MARLYRLQDRKTEEQRKQPLPARQIDENFEICRTKVSGEAGTDAVLEIKENFPKSDELKFKPPGSGTYVLGCIDGVVQWIATTECDE